MKASLRPGIHAHRLVVPPNILKDRFDEAMRAKRGDVS